MSKIGERREPARHTPRQRVRAEVSAHPKRTRPLGGATPHPLQRCAHTVPAPVPNRMRCPLSTPQSHRVPHGPLGEHCNSPAAAPPLLDAPDMHPPTWRALGAEPTDPDPPRPHTCKRRVTRGKHSSVSLVSAESELGTLPVSALWRRSLHTRSGLGRSGGATPHPQQRCAPTVPAHRTRHSTQPLPSTGRRREGGCTPWCVCVRLCVSE